MMYDLDPDLDGPGKNARVMIWRDGDARQVEMKWGFEPFEPGGRPVSLLRSERWEIQRPCLMIANEFGLRAEGKTKYRASLITDEPFFCVAGMWRPETRTWPASFAVFTVDASPDIEPYKDRHVAVVRPDDWFDWLMETRTKEEILRPFPAGSFRIVGPPRKKALVDMFPSNAGLI